METWATYWSGKTAADMAGIQVEHIASEQFSAAGVSVGDRMFVITFIDGRLHVVTSLVVDHLVPRKRAEQLLGRTDLWSASWHIIAQSSSVRSATLDATLTEKQTGALQFIGRDDVPARPARNRDGAIDPQTFRSTRRLDAKSAKVLERILASSP